MKNWSVHSESSFWLAGDGGKGDSLYHPNEEPRLIILPKNGLQNPSFPLTGDWLLPLDEKSTQFNQNQAKSNEQEIRSSSFLIPTSPEEFKHSKPQFEPINLNFSVTFSKERTSWIRRKTKGLLKTFKKTMLKIQFPSILSMVEAQVWIEWDRLNSLMIQTQSDASCPVTSINTFPFLSLTRYTLRCKSEFQIQENVE